MAVGRVPRHLVVEGGHHGADDRRVFLFVNVVSNDHRVPLGLGRDRPEGAPSLDADLGADLGDDGHPFPEVFGLDNLVRDCKEDGRGKEIKMQFFIDTFAVTTALIR